MKKMMLIILALVISVVVFAQIDITIGTGTSTGRYPFNDFYKYSRSQCLYLESEIGNPGTIHKLRWYRNDTGADPDAIGTTQIWLKTITNSVLTDANWEDPGTLVYEITNIDLGTGNSWYEVDIEDFNYTGGNLLVSVYTQDAPYTSPHAYWRYTTTTGFNSCRLGYSDTVNPPTLSLSTYRPNIQINMTVTEPTSPPNQAILVSPADGGWAFLSDSLVWQSGGGFPEGYYVYLSDNEDDVTNEESGALVSTQTETTYTPDMEPGTTYYWKVVPYNDAGPAEGCPVWSFKTPTATQLAELFTGTTFPPTGWTAPATSWVRDTSTYYSAPASAKCGYSTGTWWLITPKLSPTVENHTLSFMYRDYSSSSIYDYIDEYTYVLVSTTTDFTGADVIWEGDYEDFTTEWQQAVLDLSAYIDTNIYIAFKHIAKGGNYRYIDNVFGPEITQAPPNPAVLVYPADDGWAFLDDTLSWTTGGGTVDGYKLYISDDDNVNADDFILDQIETTYSLSDLEDLEIEYDHTYYWQVIPYNENGDAEDCPVWSFKTPTATQLAESFENTTFPPIGWKRTTPSTSYWTRSTYYSTHGSACMYAYTSTSTVYDISTPKCTITSGSTLNFSTMATSTSQKLQILYSTDRINWTKIGADITYATANVWYNISIDLSAYTGEKYLAFRSPAQTSGYYSIYVDAVFGPEITPEAPEAPTLVSPADGAENVSITPTFSWTAATLGGVPDGFKIYCGNPIDYDNPIATVPRTTTSYTIPGTNALEYNTTYYWTVSAYKEGFDEARAIERSFTTKLDPTIYTFPYIVDFTTWMPTNWSQLKYLYGGTPASGGYWVQDDWLNTATGNKAAKLNIYGETKYDWLITPPIQIPATGYELKFDLALMKYNNNNPVTVGEQPDDRFIVAISNNPDMTSSTILREWNNTGSTYVYDNIPNTGTTCNIVLSDYVGTKYIAFYGQSTVSNGDNDLMVDNVTIRAIPTGPVLYCTPTSLDFGEVAFGVQVGPKTVTVTNTGSGVLALNQDNTQIIGTGFAIDDFDFSLEANESGQINVYANATQEGPFTATLRITYGTQQCDVSLSATGLPEGIIVIGTGDEDLGLPIKPNYGYSYSQSIFLQSDIHLANRYIEKIYYYWNGAGAASSSNEWTVYMGNTDKNEFVDEDDWIPIGNLTQVFSGVVDLPAVEGWVEINLASPFYHNDTNLVIAVDENESGYDYSVYFYCTSVETKGNRSILYRNDYTNPDPASPPTGTSYNYAITGYPNIKLEFEEAQPPLPVELTTFTAVISSDNLVEISWVTQTETGMVGYYVYRSSSESLDNAIAVSDMIEALNTPEQHTYKFIDSEIYDSGNYYYWLQTVDLAGSVSFHGPVSVYYTSAEDNPIPEIPKVTELRSIYPNPFNPVAFIPYSLAEESDAHFYIYNVKGQLLRHIYVGPQYPGYYQIRWDGKDINGKSCGSGVYYIIMKAGKQTFQRKAVLMK